MRHEGADFRWAFISVALFRRVGGACTRLRLMMAQSLQCALLKWTPAAAAVAKSRPWSSDVRHDWRSHTLGRTLAVM